MEGDTVRFFRANPQSKKDKKQNKMDDFFDSPVDAEMEGIPAWLFLALQAGWWGFSGKLILFAC